MEVNRNKMSWISRRPRTVNRLCADDIPSHIEFYDRLQDALNSCLSTSTATTMTTTIATAAATATTTTTTAAETTTTTTAAAAATTTETTATTTATRTAATATTTSAAAATTTPTKSATIASRTTHGERTEVEERGAASGLPKATEYKTPTRFGVSDSCKLQSPNATAAVSAVKTPEGLCLEPPSSVGAETEGRYSAHTNNNNNRVQHAFTMSTPLLRRKAPDALRVSEEKKRQEATTEGTPRTARNHSNRHVATPFACSQRSTQAEWSQMSSTVFESYKNSNGGECHYGREIDPCRSAFANDASSLTEDSFDSYRGSTEYPSDVSPDVAFATSDTSTVCHFQLTGTNGTLNLSPISDNEPAQTTFEFEVHGHAEGSSAGASNSSATDSKLQENQEYEMREMRLAEQFNAELGIRMPRFRNELEELLAENPDGLLFPIEFLGKYHLKYGRHMKDVVQNFTVERLYAWLCVFSVLDISNLII